MRKTSLSYLFVSAAIKTRKEERRKRRRKEKKGRRRKKGADPPWEKDITNVWVCMGGNPV